MKLQDIGLIGWAVMGQNLALNLERIGFGVAVYNRTESVTKMMHNAIECGDMQLIAGAYDILQRGLKLSGNESSEIFAQWNKGPLSSYLIEITANILEYIDDKTKRPLVEMIQDQAEQKGTGRWTTQAASDLFVPIPTMNAAVEALTCLCFQNKILLTISD